MRDLQLLIPATEVNLGAGQKGTLTASVTLTGGQPERIVLKAVPVVLGGATSAGPVPVAATSSGDPAEVRVTPPPVDAWSTVERPLRELSPGVVEQFLVTFDGKLLPAGRFALKLVAYPADEAPEEYADRGSTVTVVVAPHALPRPPKRPFPWLPIAIAAAVLVVIVAGLIIFGPDHEQAPPVAVPTTSAAASDMVPIPAGLAGLTAAAAETKLTDAHLMPAEQQTAGDTVGLVIGTDPSFPASAPKGSQVNVLVDLGTPMPNLLTGIHPADAQAALEQIGLTMTPPPDPALNQYEVVTGASAKVGELVAKKPKITVTVGVVLPVLRPKQFSEARAILVQRGLNAVSEPTVSTLPVNAVVSVQTPDGTVVTPGILIEPGTTLTLEVSMGTGGGGGNCPGTKPGSPLIHCPSAP